MDKMNVFLAEAKKHYFWVLCGAIVVVSLVCWYLSTGDLDGRSKVRETKVKSQFDETKKICEVLNPPNEDVIREHHKTTLALKNNVYKTWSALYDEQKKKNSLPEGLNEKMTPEQFKQFQQEFESGGKISMAFRESYQYFIGGHLQKLWKMIDCRRAAATKARPAAGAAAAPGTRPAGGPAFGAGGPATPAEVELIGVVDWNEADRKRIESRFNFQGSSPTDLQVRLAQEDLWVYEAILRVIQKTNEKAAAHHNAPIKRILRLEIGAAAAEAFSKSRESVQLVPAGTTAGAAGAAAAAPVAAPPPPAAVPAPVAPAAAAPVLTKEEELALGNRYVDSEGKPLAANSLGKEFKMMPVLIRVVIQQKAIPKLLVECANSSMPIDVRIFRLRPSDSQGDAAASGAPTAMAGMGGAAPVGAQPVKANADGSDNFGDTDITGLDVPVEIQGVIYIYNPPDQKALGAEAAAASGGTPPTDAADKPTDKPTDKPADKPTEVPGAPAGNQTPAPAKPQDAAKGPA